MPGTEPEHTGMGVESVVNWEFNWDSWGALQPWIYSALPKTMHNRRQSLNGGSQMGAIRPLSAIWAQSFTIVHFCGLFGPFSKGNFRHKMTTIVGNRGQLWTSTLSPHLLSPHLDFPEIRAPGKRQFGAHHRSNLPLKTVCMMNAFSQTEFLGRSRVQGHHSAIVLLFIEREGTDL